MERIFIPTLNRVEEQITFNGLPSDLKKRVTMVVQSWERSKYKYDCDYLVLPKEINPSDRLCLAKTRAIIHSTARNSKYAVLDDDITFKRRNSKRFTGISNMENSSRSATQNDILEMFELFTNWLNEPTVTMCGPSQIQNIPANTSYRNNTGVFSAVFINGSHFSDILEELPLTEVRYCEDVLFNLSLLTRGYGNRSSQEFCFFNNSLTGKLPEGVWADAEFQDVWNDHKRIAELFPDFYKIELKENGERAEGGFRNFGKVTTYWSKAYKSSLKDKGTVVMKPSEPRKLKTSRHAMSVLNIEDFQIPGDNEVTLSSELEERLKAHFHADRVNRFQLYALSSGIRSKYLDPTTQKYSSHFTKWYSATGMDKLFGSLANFTKYASAGDVVDFIATKTSSPEKYLNQLPVSVGALYELSIILKNNEDAFKLCLQFTASRKTIDEPKFDWKTKKPAMINPKVTEQAVRAWRQKWENPPPPKVKRTDKRTLPLLTIYCSGELLDFDRKTGDKIGCLDLEQVEALLKTIAAHFSEENEKQFRIESKMEELTSMYFKRKEHYDVTRNVAKGRKDNSDRYV
jgi:hypothetical protein